MNFLFGVTDKDEASLFRVEESDGHFTLAFDYDDVTMYMARNEEEPTGESSLQIGGDETVEFTLHHPGPKDAAKDIEFWKKNECYIKIGNGFAAYNSKDNELQLVEDSSNTEKLWLPCKLMEELEKSADDMKRILNGPRPKKKSPIPRPNKGKEKEKPPPHVFGAEDFSGK